MAGMLSERSLVGGPSSLDTVPSTEFEATCVCGTHPKALVLAIHSLDEFENLEANLASSIASQWPPIFCASADGCIAVLGSIESIDGTRSLFADLVFASHFFYYGILSIWSLRRTSCHAFQADACHARKPAAE